MSLDRRPLGRTGLVVSPICVGTSALGSLPRLYGYEVDQARAQATLLAALAGPVNFLDTSNGYGGGESERRIGEALALLGGLPDGYVLATKIDPLDVEDGGRLDFSGERALRSVEESLDRLGLEHLELVYLHDPERIGFDEAMADDGPVATLLALQERGVVSHVGVAGGPIALLRRFVDTGHFSVVLSHNRYTLMDRSALPLFESCAEKGVGVVNGAPFGGGMLAKGPVAQPRYCYREASREVRDRAAAMQAACERYGVPLAAAALQCSLRQPLVASTVVGVTRPERVAETLEHAALEIPEDLWAELDAIGGTEGLDLD